jgi:hypothetical protein
MRNDQTMFLFVFADPQGQGAALAMVAAKPVSAPNRRKAEVH